MLKINYNKHDKYVRRHDLEWGNIAGSCVETLFRNTPQDFYKYAKCICRDGRLLFCEGGVMVDPHIPVGFNTCFIIQNNFDFNRKGHPQIFQHTNQGPQQINHFTFLESAGFLMVRLAQLTDLSLNSQNAEVLRETDRDMIRRIAKEKKISGQWNSQNFINGPHWCRSSTLPSLLNGLDYYRIYANDSNGIFAYCIEIYGMSNTEYAIFPIQNFRNRNFPEALELRIPPNPPYVLVGSENLKKYRHAPVYLTDDFIVYISNPSSEQAVYLFNPGGYCWIDELDIECLFEREVINISEVFLEIAEY